MKPLSTQVQELLREQSGVSQKQYDSTRNIIKLIEDLRDRGVLKKPEYLLPMRDTIGRSIYKSMMSVKNI
jgi:hypothetical protein